MRGRRQRIGKTITPEMTVVLALGRRYERTLAARGGVYTVKLENGGFTVNNAGFVKKYETEIDAAKALFLDERELHHQLVRRGGVVHVVIHGDRHWYC
jgi:hypothetical protein